MIEDLKRRYAKLQGLLNTPIGQSQGGLLSNIPQGALLGSSIFSQGISVGEPPTAVAVPSRIMRITDRSHAKPVKSWIA